MDYKDLITAPEAEMYIEALKPIPLRDIGSQAWLKQHEMLEKLNAQAHTNALMDTDEFVHEAFISLDKLAFLVYELVSLEMWRERVRPELEALGYAEQSTVAPYMIHYHEATVINLLEAVLYHREAVEALGDAAIDLIDYCQRACTYLLARTEEDFEREVEQENLSARDMDSMTGQAQLNYQTRTLRFNMAVKTVAIFRYLTDHVTCLSLSAVTRMLNTHDMIQTLVALVVSPPWSQRHDGQLLKFTDEGKWVDVPHQNQFQLTKPEAQVWLALYNLLMEPECRRKYEYNSHSKAEILRLRGFMNEVLLDQIPVLVELRRALEELSLMEPPAPDTSIVLEQLPEIRQGLEKINGGRWAQLAAYQNKKVFNPDEQTRKAQAKLLAETYSLDMLDSLFPEQPKCVVCGADAVNRCSRCQSEWYCRRQCQVEHWPKHKAACNLMSAAAEGKE